MQNSGRKSRTEGTTVGRPRRSGKDNIRTDLREVGWADGDWMHLAQDKNRWRALVNTVISLCVP